jgi:transposase
MSRVSASPTICNGFAHLPEAADAPDIPDPRELYRPGEVARTIAMLIEPGAVFEIRALGVAMPGRAWRNPAISGYFVCVEALLSELDQLDTARGVYLTINPPNPALLARAANHFVFGGRIAAISDNVIVARRWLSIDLDPVRPSDISSTAQERGKQPTPTAANIDSQSVRTAEGGGRERGYDAAKRVTGRQRHLVVDTLGLVLAVVVHGGHWQDHDGASFVLLRLHEQFHRLKVIFADSAYGRNHLSEWVEETLGWVMQTVLRPVGIPGCVVLPKRWIIEPTFAWISRCRRNAKDYQRKPEHGEAMIHLTITHLTMITLMSKRLANHQS